MCSSSFFCGFHALFNSPCRTGNYTVFAVQVNDATPALKVEAVFTDMLEPYPAEITQSETQMVRFTDSHYFLSPYQTETQKTTVKLASSGIESFTKLMPHAAKGSSITFGPYKDIAPLTVSRKVGGWVREQWVQSCGMCTGWDRWVEYILMVLGSPHLCPPHLSRFLRSLPCPHLHWPHNLIGTLTLTLPPPTLPTCSLPTASSHCLFPLPLPTASSHCLFPLPRRQYSPATVHYVNNKPFAKFSTVNRELEVSHWGSIAIEEIYELKHNGAKLKGGFSRFDYMMRRTGPSPSYRSLIGTLPLQANNIYYRDQIGNISTSYLRNGDGELELEIETRFPMFGGWQTQFYIGYSIPTEVALFVDSLTGRYNLKFDFFTLFEDVWVEDMEIKVVLPEGATDIKVEVPYPVEQSWTRRFTYLDSQFNGGRPVLTLRGKNIVEEMDKQVIVSYTFQRQRMIVEPMILVASFFALFVAYSFMARLSPSVKKGAKKAAGAGEGKK